MPIQRLTSVVALVSMLLLAIPAHAETAAIANQSLIAGGTSSSSPLSLNQLPILNPAPMFAAPSAPSFAGAVPAFGATHGMLAAVAKTDADARSRPPARRTIRPSARPTRSPTCARR
jgi:hypothetical protein